MLLITGLLIAIPASVYALCKVEITVYSNIVIEKMPEYEVGYLNNFKPAIFTDEELENAIKTSSTNCTLLYIGETKYNECLGVIIKDERKYKEGEIVNIKAPTYRKYIYSTSCTWENDAEYCPADTEIIYGQGSFYEIFNYNDNDYNNITHFESINADDLTYPMPANNILFAQCWGNSCK